jgi:hypothetical protein
MKINKQPKDLKISRSKVMRRLFFGAALALGTLMITACANAYPPAPVEAPTATASPTETPLPVPTLTLTPTEDPFEGLKVCRTWQEAANCPITPDDFARLPGFVKANYKFPPEAFKVSLVELAPMLDRTSYVLIHALFREKSTPGFAETSGVKGKIYVFDYPWSPVGEPFFFNLEKNPPEITHDNLTAVFPVNNADGSFGTYTIVVPPYTWSGDYKSAEEWNADNLAGKFDRMAYLPPAYHMGWIPISNYDGLKDSTLGRGNLLDSILQETNDPNGKRIKLINKWVETGVIPKELEELPLFGSQFNLNGGFDQ